MRTKFAYEKKEMLPTSLTFKTNSIFWRFEGEVSERDDYCLVRTPTNPTYYDGNLLYFDRPPLDGDYQRWLKFFEREFSDQPTVSHMLFIWDMPDKEVVDVEQFLDGGFEVQSNVALLTSDVVQPHKFNQQIVVRWLEGDDDWEALLEAKLKLRDARFSLETYAPFKKRWLDVRRQLTERGKGNWFGAFLGETLVGDLGLFHDGSIARFQDVATDPEFRRQGICGTLVYEASKQALRSGGISSLVMVADENYHAARIYESVGFRPVEHHTVACRYPSRV